MRDCDFPPRTAITFTPLTILLHTGHAETRSGIGKSGTRANIKIYLAVVNKIPRYAKWRAKGLTQALREASRYLAEKLRWRDRITDIMSESLKDERREGYRYRSQIQGLQGREIGWGLDCEIVQV